MEIKWWLHKMNDRIGRHSQVHEKTEIEWKKIETNVNVEIDFVGVSLSNSIDFKGISMYHFMPYAHVHHSSKLNFRKGWKIGFSIFLEVEQNF